MHTETQFVEAGLTGVDAAVEAHPWVPRARFLWQHRSFLLRVAVVSFAASLSLAFLIPKRYTAVASIMPPDQSGTGALMLAALAGHASGLNALSSFAGGLLGLHSNTAILMSLLHSGTISGALIEHFDLRHVYGVRYQRDAAKKLARATKISDDKKSGLITITVEDRSPVRARDMAQCYLDELNKLLSRTSTSQARQERIFIENRLGRVGNDLEQAQIALSEFSSRNSTVDIKEQTRAMVDAGARLQGELLVEQSGLEALKQVYGDGNLRVRQTEARIAALRGDLRRMAGSASEVDADTAAVGKSELLYPPLRQLPKLAVPYADLYRRVRVQESVFELLTSQYEMARIAEAREMPVLSVIDAPSIPEKKSFPPRVLLTLALTLAGIAGATCVLFLREAWEHLAAADPRKLLWQDLMSSSPWRRGASA